MCKGTSYWFTYHIKQIFTQGTQTLLDKHVHRVVQTYWEVKHLHIFQHTVLSRRPSESRDNDYKICSTLKTK